MGGGLPEKPHTLEDYAVDHFRPPPKRTMSKGLTLTSAASRKSAASRNGMAMMGKQYQQTDFILFFDWGLSRNDVIFLGGGGGQPKSDEK